MKLALPIDKTAYSCPQNNNNLKIDYSKQLINVPAPLQIDFINEFKNTLHLILGSLLALLKTGL